MMMLISTASTALILWAGWRYFAQTEDIVADLLETVPTPAAEDVVTSAE